MFKSPQQRAKFFETLKQKQSQGMTSSPQMPMQQPALTKPLSQPKLTQPNGLPKLQQPMKLPQLIPPVPGQSLQQPNPLANRFPKLKGLMKPKY